MSTVLVIEDSRTELQLLISCLRQGGFDVIAATSCEEGLEKISCQKPDAIVLDIVLPGRSGFELCRDLKADAATSTIPVVLCSTKGTHLDIFWGIRQGADAYLAKPIDREELLRTVRRLL